MRIMNYIYICIYIYILHISMAAYRGNICTSYFVLSVYALSAAQHRFSLLPSHTVFLPQ